MEVLSESPYSANASTDIDKRLASFQNGGMEIQVITQILAKPKIKRSVLLDEYSPSTADVNYLKPIFIRDLRLGDRHSGNYLLLRSQDMPLEMEGGLLAVAEDEKRDQITIEELVGFRPGDNPDDQKVRSFKKGVVFLIKEPIFKALWDGNISLIVNIASDMVLLDVDVHHKLYPRQWKSSQFCNPIATAEDWRKDGNDAMEKKDFWEAIECYSTALASSPSPDERDTILRNRALAYLKDRMFESALRDTQCLPITSPKFGISEKALYRAALALHGLRRFAAYNYAIKTLQEKHPSFVIPDPQLLHLDTRKAEELHGKYDWRAMVKEATRIGQMKETNRPSPELDFATFVGPVVVKDCCNRKEKGLFTKKAVKAGQLLFCEKALACVYTGTPGVQYDHEDIFTKGTLVMEIVQKVRRNPRLLREFSTLYRDNDVPVSHEVEGGMPIVDPLQVDKIVTFNNFSSRLKTSEHSSPQCFGLWSLAARINHSCTSNARRGFIGDFLVARATRDIPKDKEITWPYYKHTRDIDDVQKELAERGFQCTCAICIDGTSTPVRLLTKRKNLIQTLKITLDALRVNTKRAEQLISECEKTYTKPATEVPRIELAQQCRRLMNVYRETLVERKSAVFAIKYLECIGFVITGGELPAEEKQRFKVVKWGLSLDPVASVFGVLRELYVKHAPQLVQQLSRYMRLAWMMVVGEEVL